ncbi:hypothetical protein ACFUYE_00460 [Micromonospora humida]|uniref:hypothetical protein n=1 Tax=Micromonospora humida TaxID=2809018 RepID=UPI00366DBF82
MSPAQLAAEEVVLGHLAASLPTLTDVELSAVAAEHAVAQGHYATAARRLLLAELDRRHPAGGDPEPAPTPQPQPAFERPPLPRVPPLGPIPGTSGRPGPDVAPRWPLTTSATPTPEPFTLADDLFPTATDPALDGYAPPTLDDLGLSGDPVAMVISLRAQAAVAQARIAELIAGMTAEQRADLAQYEPARHLRAVA